MRIWVFSLASVVVVSLVSLVGLATLSLNERLVHRLAAGLVSFAVGTLLGDAFIHLVPEALAGEGTPLGPSLLILSGNLLFFVVERLLRHRHVLQQNQEGGRPELAAINLFGDGIHNFIDGVLIGASYMASPVLGISTTIAVLFHEIPQELADFGVLIHSGLGVRKAVLLNLASASVSIVGTLAALLVGSAVGTVLTTVLVPITAGGFVYIAAADLIPELQHDRHRSALPMQASLIALGIATMALLTFVS